jgi:hypothetical protein
MRLLTHVVTTSGAPQGMSAVTKVTTATLAGVVVQMAKYIVEGQGVTVTPHHTLCAVELVVQLVPLTTLTVVTDGVVQGDTARIVKMVCAIIETASAAETSAVCPPTRVKVGNASTVTRKGHGGGNTLSVIPNLQATFT